jgi:hypothetical protein
MIFDFNLLRFKKSGLRMPPVAVMRRIDRDNDPARLTPP